MKNAPRFSVGDQVYVVCDVSGDETRPPCYAEQYLKPYTISKGEIVAVRKPSAEQPYPYEVDVPSEDCVVDSTEELVAKTATFALVLAKASEGRMRQTLLATCLPTVLVWGILASDRKPSSDGFLALMGSKALRRVLLRVTGHRDLVALKSWGAFQRSFWLSNNIYDRKAVAASVKSTLRLMAWHAGCHVTAIVESLPKECQVKGEHLLLQEVLQILKAALPLRHAQAMARGLGT